MAIQFLLLATLLPSALAQVVGSAKGFAAGVTGGGKATPQVPADWKQLAAWLSDATPRVIMLDKEYSFIGTEGRATDTGCRPASNSCPNAGGQDAINGPNWCSNSKYPKVQVTYDKASTGYIDVKSNKSIVGKGAKGVIRGKGLRIANGAKNVIIQNVHITDLNPQYIWGGDAITLTGSDMVWIDHCKFSLIGREMIVTGHDQAGKVTISNNEFDGTTKWSSSCNGDHYWTMLIVGSNDQITLANNHFHNCSGRAPKIGGGSTSKTVVQAVNNLFSSMGGHAFDVAVGGQVLIEGNVFESVTTPITAASAKSGGRIFNVPASNSGASCQGPLGRPCVQNSLTKSGDFGTYTDATFLKQFGKSLVKAEPVAGVAASVRANSGVGKVRN